MDIARTGTGVEIGAGPPSGRARIRAPGGTVRGRVQGAQSARLLIGAAVAAVLGLGLPAAASAAATATFNPGTGTLSVFGDAQDDTIEISRDTAGSILVNGGAVVVAGGGPTVANTTLIEVSGGAGNDRLTLSEANGPLPAAHLSGGAGDDVLTGGAAADQLDGGAGNDTLFGRGGADTLIGGAGNDTLIGGAGNDRLFGSAGADVFQWDPGDDNDVIEGEAGADTLRFNGANVNEAIDISANGGRVRFTRNVAAIMMDVNGVERIEFTARGGADTITVNDLRGTDADVVALDLAGTPGAGTGDGQADQVVVNGTSRGDTVTVAQSGDAVAASGLAARVEVRAADAALDTLHVNGLEGNDTISAQTLPAGVINLVLDGGAGNDRLTGSAGDDTLDGGAGDDRLDGGAGTDIGLNGETVTNIP